MSRINNSGNNQAVVTRYNVLIISIGWICAILSLAFVPFIFGPAGVMMGIISTKDQNRAGLSLIVASIILMGIGLIFSGVIRNYMMHYFGI
jgi:hypothetical protein